MHVRKHEEAAPNQKNPEDCRRIRDRSGDRHLHCRPQLSESKTAKVGHYRPARQQVKQRGRYSKPGIEKQKTKIPPGKLFRFTDGWKALAEFVTTIKLRHIVT